MAIDKKARLIPWERLEVDEAFNARQRYDGIGELAANIRSAGLIVPLEVEELEPGPHGEERYRLIGGFRRHRAMTSLRAEVPRGKVKPFDKVSVRIFKGDELEAYLRNLQENGGRKDLRLWELGARCLLLKERFKLEAADIARRVGFSKAYVYQAIKVSGMAPPILAHCKRSDIPVDLLVRWSPRTHEQQIKEFQAWQAQNETKTPGSKRSTRTPAPFKLAKERAAQAPILLRALRQARKPKAWKDGAMAVVKWMAGQTVKPPVPLSPR